MSVHAVAAIAPGKVITRETSCHCQQCFTNGIFNPESPCLWKQHLLKECPEEAEVVPVVGDWVAAVYDDKWYVGKVLAVDLTENDANISFMHDSKKASWIHKMANPSRYDLDGLQVCPGCNRASCPLWKNPTAVQAKRGHCIDD